MDGKEPQSYPELLEVATAIVGPFKQLLERICRASGFKPSERCVSNPKMTRLQIAPLKGQERADEKVTPICAELKNFPTLMHPHTNPYNFVRCY